MRAGLIDDFIRNILSVPFCPCHFVHTILSNTILPVYHFVHTILSVPFCPLPFCPRTQKSRTKSPVQILSQLFAEVLSGGFCPGWFLSVPPSVTIHLLQQKV